MANSLAMLAHSSGKSPARRKEKQTQILVRRFLLIYLFSFDLFHPRRCRTRDSTDKTEEKRKENVKCGLGARLLREQLKPFHVHRQPSPYTFLTTYCFLLSVFPAAAARAVCRSARSHTIKAANVINGRSAM